MLNFWSVNTIGELSSIIGLLVGIIGFLIIIFNVRKSKESAEEAMQLSKQVRSDILKADLVAVFALVFSGIEEIKILQRKEDWGVLPEKYSSLRISLISMRAIYKDFSDEQMKIIQSAVTSFRSLEQQIEKCLYRGVEPDIPKLNTILSKQLDKLQPIIIDIRNQIGR